MSQSPVQLASELIKSLEAQIDSADMSPTRLNSGEVVYLGDGIAKVVGLKNVAYNEVVAFDSGARGVALNLDEHSV
jgi:F-type H+-transporting ATPase subunit alpha